MSGTSEEFDIDISQLWLNVIDDWVVTAAAAWISYEWLVTFGQEIQYIWARKWTWSTLIFAGNRYATLAIALSEVSPAPDNANCIGVIRLINACILLQNLSLALFTAMRIWAFCDRKVWVFLAIFVLSASPFIVNMVTFIIARITFDPIVGTCHQFLPWHGTLQLGVSLATRIPAIIADIIAVIVTWKHARGVAREASRLPIRVPLGGVLLEGGTSLFLALLAANVSMVLLNNVPALSKLGIASEFVTALPSILTCRFMLNLREAVYKPDPLAASTMGNYSTLRFHIASDALVGDQEQPSGSEDEDERSDERQNKRYHPVATDDIERSGDTVESQGFAARTSQDPLVEAEGLSHAHITLPIQK